MELTIPTSWEDISIGKYMELRPAISNQDNEVTRVINILCVLSSSKREEVKDISLKNLNYLIDKMSFLNDPLPQELDKKRFIIGGKWYEFKLQANKLLFGEYISIMEILQKAENNEEVLFNNLHHILTVLCRPVYKTMFGFRDVKVDTDLIRETAKNFYDNMPITIAYPIAVFFYQRFPNLTETIKTSLMEEANKRIKEVKMDLEADGVGGV